MQTFLPYESFVDSAHCLDNRRLGKQRVEAWQILNVLAEIRAGRRPAWFNHPAVRMWENHEYLLAVYGEAVCLNWVTRGFKDTLMPKFVAAQEELTICVYPWWLGNEKFHRSHQSNLLRKLPSHYEQFGWDVPNDLPYFWPTKQLNRKDVR